MSRAVSECAQQTNLTDGGGRFSGSQSSGS